MRGWEEECEEGDEGEGGEGEVEGWMCEEPSFQRIILRRAGG